jgi:tetratricopeptide (TPR) repeat protein
MSYPRCTIERRLGRPVNTDAGKDFFISYTSADKKWAEWIAWQLEEAQYSTILQAWDFRPGMNFVAEMDDAAKHAERTIPVLSSAYLASDYAFTEWAAAFRHDPKGKDSRVLPVRIQRCEIKGLLGSIVYIDLVDLDEATAHETLLVGVRRERGKPEAAPDFPGGVQHTIPEPQRFPGALPPLWNMPYPRNPYFTGREDILKKLYDALRTDKTAAITQSQAIGGLGGIGKTQSAVEYAYRYHNDYQAVLWARAETRQLLILDFVAVAGLLNLSEKDIQDQNKVVEAVKLWLKEHRDWLLIFDNADDLAIVREFVPPTFGGHILLTTRAQAMGRLAHRIEIEKMEPWEGALFLLRRAGIIEESDVFDEASEAKRNKAKEISQEMDGLPLALDQAGAYIEETSCGLAGYLDLYQKHGATLLKRRGGLIADHPEPVATTWSLSFEKVELANPAAAELLRLCAFLAPDAIPEGIITGGAPDLGRVLQPVASDPFELNAAIEELHKFSLVKRDPDAKTLTIHRLVQAVLKESMNGQTRREWAERTVRAVNLAFPDVTDVALWEQCERYLPHALACAALIEQWDMALPEAAKLLNNSGDYLTVRAQYEQAEPLYQRALTIWERVLGPEHPNTAASLFSLASLYDDQSKYEQAELLYLRAHAIWERVLGPEHPNTAASLNNLAELYRKQGKYKQAEPLYQRALTIYERVLGPEHPSTATSLNNLALLYKARDMYKQAEPLYQRALTIYERVLGPEHPNTAASLNNLAEIYQAQGKNEQAEPLLQRALAIDEKAYGPDHPEVATDLNNLAVIYRAQGKNEQAEPLLVRALAIKEQQLGPEHPDTATSLNNLAALYDVQGRYEQAEPLLVRALAIKEQQLGPEHPDTQIFRENYVALLRTMGRDAEAVALETKRMPPS